MSGSFNVEGTALLGTNVYQCNNNIIASKGTLYNYVFCIFVSMMYL